MNSTETNPPYKSRDNGDVKINLTRLGVIFGVLATLVALAGAWLVLPYRVEQAEKSLDVFEIRTERRFEATEAEQRTQREILIRIDENVKQLRREARSPNREP